MDANIKTTTLEVSSLVYSGENICSAESDLIVPDNMPDIGSVLQISACCATSACDSQTDRILLTGNVFFNILYIADTPQKEVRAINAKAVFSNIFSAPGVKDTMPVFSSANVSRVSFKLANCRKLSVHGDVLGSVKVYNNSSVTLPTEIEGAEMKTCPVSFSVIKAHGNAQESVTDSFELAPSKSMAIEILRDELTITDKAIKVIHNKAIIKGTACISVLYRGENGPEMAKADIPFTKVVSVEGLEDNMDVSFTIDIQGWETRLTPNENGENRIIDVETMLYFNVVGRVSTSTNAITDAYFPGCCLECSKNALSVSTSDAAETEECGIKGTVKLPSAIGEIESVCDIKGLPKVLKVRRSENDIVIDGCVCLSILYKTNNPEEKFASIDCDIDFSHSINGEKYADIPTVSAELKHTNYSISAGNALDIRGLVYLNITSSSSCEKNLVTEVKLKESEKTDAPSILISYINSNSSLWDIAKSYNISQNKLMSANGIKTEDELKNCCALVIPR